MTDLAYSIKQAVYEFVEPHSGLSLKNSGSRVAVEISRDALSVEVVLSYPLRAGISSITDSLVQELQSQSEGISINVKVTQHIESATALGNLKPIQGIKNIMVVASGKGGVGKSTTAANLALALAQDGAVVGLLDADIYGPSQARMMGLTGQHPSSRDGKSFEPLMAHGLKVSWKRPVRARHTCVGR